MYLGGIGMKKFLSFMLVTLLILTSFAGCGKSSGSAENEAKPWPNEVAKGATYTLACGNKTTGEAMDVLYLDGSSTDNGRINDGSYRTVEEMERDLGDDKIVLLQGDATREYTVTFENKNQYEVFSVLFHNTRQVQGNSLMVKKIEIGDSTDTLQEVKFKEKTEKVGVGDLMNVRLSFPPVAGKVIRVTFDSDGQGICAFEEISLIGYPVGEQDKWLKGSYKNWDGVPDSVVQ
jgi:hypothetical protein